MRKLLRSPGLCFACLLLISTVCANGATPLGQQSAQAPLVLDDITKGWLSREKGVSSFAVTWKVRHTYVKGSITGPNFPPGKFAKSGVVPEDDYTFEAPLSLKSNGQKLRYEYSWQMWNEQLSQFEDVPRIELFDGKTNTIFTANAQGISTASIRPEPYALPLANLQIRPIALAFLPSAMPIGAFNMDKLVLTSQRAIVDNVECRVLQLKGSSWTYWVDPNKGYSVVRGFSETKAGELLYKLEIDLQNERGLWLPKSWQLSAFNPSSGELLNNTVAFDISYLINDGAPDSAFDLALPPKTLITDAKDHGKKPASHFVIAEDNSKRPVSRSELRTNDWQELVKPKVNWIYTVGWIVAAALAIVAVVWLFLWGRDHTSKRRKA